MGSTATGRDGSVPGIGGLGKLPTTMRGLGLAMRPGVSGEGLAGVGVGTDGSPGSDDAGASGEATRSPSHTEMGLAAGAAVNGEVAGG